jgi:hypothetical protein
VGRRPLFHDLEIISLNWKNEVFNLTRKRAIFDPLFVFDISKNLTALALKPIKTL